ncbi:DUF2512 family protein [Bacillus sp. N3536]|nr:DUF2512 family protein [Bacillus sp. N3536]
MNHFKALLIKFVMITVVLIVVLTLIFDVPFMDSIWTSLILTVLAYILGDFLLFRLAANRSSQNVRNMIATGGDIIIAFLTIWYMQVALVDVNGSIALGSFIAAVIIGAGEWFFHQYLDGNVVSKNTRTTADLEADYKK